jgi:DNA topoisomerase-1
LRLPSHELCALSAPQKQPGAAPNAAAVAPPATAADDSDSDDDVPLNMRRAPAGAAAAVAPAVKTEPARKSPGPSPAPVAKKRKIPAASGPPAKARNLVGGGHMLLEEDTGDVAWWDEEDDEEDDPKIQWRGLEHNGVIFPPPYASHGKPLLYGPSKKAIPLSPECEEVATFFAQMINTEHAKDKVFQENFFRDFLKVLNAAIKPGDPRHEVQDFGGCDFSQIVAWCESEQERKKAVPNEEKKKLKAIKDEHDAPYRYCKVNGRKEKVGNMMVEPPGLFRGRGEHPKKGTHKHRVVAEQIRCGCSLSCHGQRIIVAEQAASCGCSDAAPACRSINIGVEGKVPICPMPGHEWGEVLHNSEVSWLAYWEENVLNSTKYVRLANESSIKGKSDLKKYETARKLKDHIEDVREWYTRKLRSKNQQDVQMAVAVFLIDRLALRVGGEKNTDEEADTVGCCSLRVEHVSLAEPDLLTLDFLGKDSIRNHQTLALVELFGEIGGKVFAKLPELMKGKEGKDDIFDTLTPTMVNQQMHHFMPKLTAKVFRTYNASIVLDQELAKMPGGLTLEEKKVFYTEANTRVALLCNHQRSVAADHGQKMAKLDEQKVIDETALSNMKKALPKAKKAGSAEVKEYVKKKLDKKPTGKCISAPHIVLKLVGGCDKLRRRAPGPPFFPGKWEKKKKSQDQIEKAIDRLTKKIEKQVADMAMKVCAPPSSS